jgi:hypothetical protein
LFQNLIKAIGMPSTGAILFCSPYEDFHNLIIMLQYIAAKTSQSATFSLPVYNPQKMD